MIGPHALSHEVSAFIYILIDYSFKQCYRILVYFSIKKFGIYILKKKYYVTIDIEGIHN